MNKWALITGASSGIGYELARLFAADRYNLVLVARNETRLKQVADELQTTHGISVQVLPKDLSQATAPAEIFQALRDIPVSVLVNNAGFGWSGEFCKGDRQLSLEMMRVNMDSLVQLTHLFAQPLVARGEGRILNVASTAAFQPGPWAAIYYASKAFVFSFSVALAEELADAGVTVTAFCPGATRTEFFERANMQRSSPLLRLMPAEKVARIGYRGLMSGKRIVIPGVMNKITSTIARCLPPRVTARIVRKINTS
jgi:short-subunit dehydrogenase